MWCLCKLGNVGAFVRSVQFNEHIDDILVLGRSECRVEDREILSLESHTANSIRLTIHTSQKHIEVTEMRGRWL